MGDDGTACIADYGLTHATRDIDFSTVDVAGPVRWLAPEIIESDAESFEDLPYTYSSDVYAFAMTSIEVRASNLLGDVLIKYPLCARRSSPELCRTSISNMTARCYFAS